jgi:esterase/lipase superfamily enzyme
MNREYHRWDSPSLGRVMELLVFGHGGRPVLVFPSSCGRFFEFEDSGMVAAIGDRIDRGEVQLFCVDSVDEESWYNRNVGPRWRIARHVQYERYCMDEVLPLIRQSNPSERRIALGCSFGGYHAVNIALRHPAVFEGFLSMSGAFDTTGFLGGYHDDDVYFNQPVQYIQNAHGDQLEQYQRGTYILATAEWDICRGFNERMGGIFASRGIPYRLDTWGEQAKHDWPIWHRMMKAYF